MECPGNDMFQVKVCHISDRIVYEGDADRALLPGVMGCLEIVEEHVAIVSLLSTGEIILNAGRSELEKKEFSIRQGLMRYDGECLYVIVE